MKKQLILIQLGKKIHTERLKRGISQERLGQLAKVHRTYIGMVERAEKNITLVSIQKIAKALDLTVSELLDF